MQVTTDLRKVPAESQWEVEEFERLGFTWDYVFGARMPDVTQRPLQVRDTEEIAPASQVTMYAEFYELGDRFPAPVFARCLTLIDGNTRVLAMVRNGYETLDYFRLKERYDNAPDSIRSNFEDLASALNNRHGRKMSKTANNRQVLRHAENGQSQKEIAASLHLRLDEVNTILAQDAGEKRAKRLGIDPTEVKVSHIRAMGKRSLDDDVWAALLKLDIAAGLSVDELNQISRRLRELTSVKDMLALIEQETVSYRPRIRGFTSRINKSGVVKRGIGSIQMVKNSPELAIIQDAADGRDYLQRVEEGIATLTKIANFQRAALEIHNPDALVPAFKGA